MDRMKPVRWRQTVAQSKFKGSAASATTLELASAIDAAMRKSESYRRSIALALIAPYFVLAIILGTRGLNVSDALLIVAIPFAVVDLATALQPIVLVVPPVGLTLFCDWLDLLAWSCVGQTHTADALGASSHAELLGALTAMVSNGTMAIG